MDHLNLIFNSKGGAGAVGNLIISSAGELLGVDMTDFGFGYSLKTRAVISSNCGQGRGGRVRPILGKVKKSKKVKVRKSEDPNSIDDEIVTSPKMVVVFQDLMVVDLVVEIMIIVIKKYWHIHR